jgi:hypothetical protein
MTDEYLAFCIAYDHAFVLESLELSSDEAFELCMNIVQIARDEELYYNTFFEWVDQIFRVDNITAIGDGLVEMGLLLKDEEYGYYYVA